MTAPDRMGDTIVAGVRRTGMAERKAPPVTNSMATSTMAPAPPTPIRTQSRRSVAGAAPSAARLIRRAERSAFLASMPLNRNTSGQGPSVQTRPEGYRPWAPASGASRLGRWIPENTSGRPLRRLLFLLLAAFDARRRSRGGHVRRQRLAGDHHLDLFALQRLALQQRRGQAIERSTPLEHDTRRLGVGAREDVLHFFVHDLGGAIGNLPTLDDFAAEEDLLLAVAHGNRTDHRAHPELRHHAARDVGRLLDILRGARRHLLRPEHQLLGDAAAVRHREPRFDRALGVLVQLFLRQIGREAECAAAWNDRHLVQWIGVWHGEPDEGVAGFMIRDETPLLVREHATLALEAQHHFVLRVL